MDHPRAFCYAPQMNGAGRESQLSGDRLWLRVRRHDRARDVAPPRRAEDDLFYGGGDATDRKGHADDARAGDGDLMRIAADLRRGGLGHRDRVLLALRSGAGIRVPRVDDDPAEPSPLDMPTSDNARCRDHLVSGEDTCGGAGPIRI